MTPPDTEKIVQGGKYLASKSPEGKINRLLAVKLMFLADRYHIRKYGRPITWDGYVAVPHGPAGSKVMNLFNQNEDWLDEEGLDYSVKNLEKVNNNYEIKAKGSVDEDVFSESDVEAIDFARTHFGNIEQFELADHITHLFPEWYTHAEVAKRSAYSINYTEFFLDPDPNHPLINKEDFKKYSHLIQTFIEHSNPGAREIFLENNGHGENAI